MKKWALSCLCLAWLLPGCGLDAEGTMTLPGEGGMSFDATTTDGGLPGTQDSNAGDGTLDATGDAAGNDGSGGNDVFEHPDTAVDGCVPAGAETCTDGVDNDCNGLVDCADPACGAFACVPAAPATWALTAAATGSSPAACPAGYPTTRQLVANPSVTASTCNCSCVVGTSPSCVTGSFNSWYGGGCGMQFTPTNANGGACLTPGGLTIASTVRVDPLPPTGGSCAASLQANLPPAQSTPLEACGHTGAFGGGCSSGSVCAPKIAPPFSTCVASSIPKAACPAGYPNVLAAGTSVTDSRGCSVCGCGGETPTATCTGAQWRFYTSGNCSGGGATAFLTADGQCDPTGQNGMTAFNSNQYVASVENAACAPPTPSVPTGGISLASEETICCR